MRESMLTPRATERCDRESLADSAADWCCFAQLLLHAACRAGVPPPAALRVPQGDPERSRGAAARGGARALQVRMQQQSYKKALRRPGAGEDAMRKARTWGSCWAYREACPARDGSGICGKPVGTLAGKPAIAIDPQHGCAVCADRAGAEGRRE
jgi:hypothetical protein